MVTCGIYAIYFWYKCTEDTNRICRGIGKDQSFAKYILLGIITCGIYDLVYMYTMLDRLNTKAEQTNANIPVKGSLLMFLCMFVPIFSYYVLCETLNVLDN